MSEKFPRHTARSLILYIRVHIYYAKDTSNMFLKSIQKIESVLASQQMEVMDVA